MMAKLSGLRSTILARPSRRIVERSFRTYSSTANFIVSSRSRRLVRSADHGDPNQQSASPEREVKLWAIKNRPCVPRPLKHQVPARLLDQAAAFFRSHRTRCNSRWHTHRLLVAFQKLVFSNNIMLQHGPLLFTAILLLWLASKFFAWAGS